MMYEALALAATVVVLAVYATWYRPSRSRAEGVRRRRWLALCAVVALAASACGEGGDGQGTGETGETPEQVKVGLALSGPRNDRGFYQAHYDGLLEAEETLGIEIAVVDGLEDPQSWADALTDLAEDNDLVIGGGAEFAESANAVAPQFPDVEFVVSSGITDPTIPNVHSYVIQQEAPAYVAGAMAASLTTTGKIGFIGGVEIPPTFLSDEFFEEGAKSVDPSVGYVSTIIGTFNDPVKGREAAEAQIASGVDVIYAFLDAAIPGVIQAVEESGKDVKLFNPITDRCDESSQLVGYTLFGAPKLVVAIVNDYMQEQLPPGTTFFKFEDPDIQSYRFCEAHSTPELQALADDLTSKIDSGEIALVSEG